jgi:uncharacterized protein DUF3108
MRIALLTVAVLLLAPCARADELQPFQASYTMSYSGLGEVMSSSVTLTQTAPDQWDYKSVGKPHGLASLIAPKEVISESHLQITASGVQPLSYRADDAAGRNSRGLNIKYDWANNKITGTDSGQTIDMALKPGVQDDSSLQIALIHDLLAGKVPTTVSIYDKTGIRDYQFTQTGTETLHTPMGDIPTVVYKSQRTTSPRYNLYWCAPSLGFLPLKVEQKRIDDDVWTLTATAARRGTPSP